MLFMFLWFVWNQPVLRMLKYEDIDRLFAQKGLYVLVDFNYHCSICSSYFIRCSKITSLFFQSVVNKVIIIIMTIITIIIIIIIIIIIMIIIILIIIIIVVSKIIS